LKPFIPETAPEYPEEWSDVFAVLQLHRLELLRQVQAKDGNSGHQLTGKQPAAIELPH